MYKKKIKYNNPMVKTEFRKKKKNGYEVVLDGITWVQEHRCVVEAYIGRKLTKEEVVYHINGLRTDNRIENLMIFPSQREHKSFENKVKRFPYLINQMRIQIETRWKAYGK
jgi:hypothetical protein